MTYQLTINSGGISFTDTTGATIRLDRPVTITSILAGVFPTFLSADVLNFTSGTKSITMETSGVSAINGTSVTQPIATASLLTQINSAIATTTNGAVDSIPTANSTNAVSSGGVAAAIAGKPDDPSVDSFAAAKLLVTTGVKKKFLIRTNELFNYPTDSTYDGTNWYHSPAIQQNN